MFTIKMPFTYNAIGYILYYTVTVFLLVTMLTRHSLDMLNIGDHMSNFSLSLAILFYAGAANMLKKVSWKFIVMYAAILVAANLIVEIFVSILNTKDPVDAVFGVTGTCTALLLLLLLHRYGLRPNRDTVA